MKTVLTTMKTVLPTVKNYLNNCKNCINSNLCLCVKKDLQRVGTILGYCINVCMLSSSGAFSSHWLLMLDGVPLSCLIDAVQHYTKNDLSCEERKCVAENAFALLMQKTKSIKKPSFLLQLIFCTFCCQKYSLVFSAGGQSRVSK